MLQVSLKRFFVFLTLVCVVAAMFTSEPMMIALGLNAFFIYAVISESVAAYHGREITPIQRRKNVYLWILAVLFLILANVCAFTPARISG